MKHKQKMQESAEFTTRIPKDLLRRLDAQVQKNPALSSRNHAITLAIRQMLDSAAANKA